MGTLVLATFFLLAKFLPAAKPTGLVELNVLLSSFFFLNHFVQKQPKQAYVVWAINFKSEAVWSKPHFLCFPPIDGTSRIFFF